MPKFLDKKELVALGITYSPASLDRLEKLGQFPKRRKIGPRRVAWLESDNVAYLAVKAASV